jgi:hypothetical protein
MAAIMSIDVDWVIEGRLLHVVFPVVLESSLLREYDEQMVARLENAPGKVHFIADLSVIKTMPNLSVMVGLRHPYHHRLGYGLTVGLTRNPVGRFLISMGAQVMGVHQRDFNTFNEARSYLHEMEGI